MNHSWGCHFFSLEEILKTSSHSYNWIINRQLFCLPLMTIHCKKIIKTWYRYNIINNGIGTDSHIFSMISSLESKYKRENQASWARKNRMGFLKEPFHEQRRKGAAASPILSYQSRQSWALPQDHFPVPLFRFQIGLRYILPSVAILETR